LTETSNMIEHATEFYKTLFGNEPRGKINLDAKFWEEGGESNL
jgi:hypothetical protein